MRTAVSRIRNLVLNDTEFAVVVLLTAAMAVAMQIVVAPAPEVTLSLVALFITTLAAEFLFGRPH